MSNNIRIVELSKYTAPVINESNRDEWVEYGDDNNYYQYLIDRYDNSTTNNAIINNICRLIYGKGLGAKNSNKNLNDWVRFLSMISTEDLKRVITDLYMLGQCAFQIHYDDKHKTILKAFHMPIMLLRPQKCNEEGEIKNYYFSNNWTDTKKFKPTTIPAFGTSKEKIEILCVQPYSVGMKYFAKVDYLGGLDYALLEEKIAEFLINDVTNCFAPTTIVNFNNGKPTDEEQEQTANKVINKLTGSTGKKVVVSFNEDETKKTTIDSIPLSDAPEHYQYLADESSRKIMLAHNVTSPLLFGIASTNGFSSNADELKNSAILFDNMVIKPKQNIIIEALNKILAFNGMSLDLMFETLQPLDVNGELTKEDNGTDVQMSSDLTELETYLSSIGEDITDEWVLVDERDVDYDLEHELDLQLTPKQTTLSKIVNLVSTGKANPRAKSFQDQTIDGIKWKVRYQYTGNANPERAFCKAMMNLKKVYRREDLEAMDSMIVNPGFEHANEPYNVFLFKGGPRCKHSFKRLTFASVEGAKDVDVTNPNAKKVPTGIASKRGFKVTNPYQVSIQPNNLPNKGFHPNNTNLPKDAK